jgi:midasin
MDIQLSHLATLESMIIGVQKRFPVLLVGESGAGKTGLIQSLAAISGAHLVTFPLSSDIDASDLVGSYEQADVNLDRIPFLKKFWEVANKLASRFLCQDASYAIEFFGNLHSVRTATPMFEMPVKQIDAATDALQSVVHSGICSSEVAMLLQEGQEVKYQMSNINGPRFKWVDSALVKALERGDWIVLDNANLCKAAVLDRLNSLLEPNGELVVTEQPLSDGTVRIVRPHKNFRLFLTMDPKNGDLSNAMHNRVMELFVPKLQPSASCEPFWLESSMYRFRSYMREYDRVTIESEELGVTIADHLALPDTALTKRFSSQVEKGLLPADTEVHEVAKVIGALYLISDVAMKLDLGSNRGEDMVSL